MIISEEALASGAQVPAEEIDRLVELGLLHRSNGDVFVSADIPRVRIIEELTSRGIPIEALAEAARDGAVSFSWFEGVLSPPSEIGDETYAELFDRTGLPLTLVTQLFEDWGVAMPPLSARARDDDARLAEYLAEFKARVRGDGDVLVEGTRYFGDGIRRIAESQVAFFRRRVLEPLLDSGVNLQDAIESVNPLVDEIVRPGARELMLWLHRRHMDAMSMQMLVETVETALEDAGIAVPKSVHPPAIAFIDLSSFTSHTAQGGDDSAADLAVRFSDIVRAEITHLNGSIVKFLGDGVMLHFIDPTSAVKCANRIVEQAREQGLPPARAGLDVGNLVFRDGDYFGKTVNVAARITDYARPGEVLISDAAAQHLGEPSTVTLRPVGPVALKGVSDSVTLHTVMSAGGESEPP